MVIRSSGKGGETNTKKVTTCWCMCDSPWSRLCMQTRKCHSRQPRSYHWALAQITLGAHDVNPVNSSERLVAILCNLFGLLFAGTPSWTHLRSSERRHQLGIVVMSWHRPKLPQNKWPTTPLKVQTPRRETALPRQDVSLPTPEVKKRRQQYQQVISNTFGREASSSWFWCLRFCMCLSVQLSQRVSKPLSLAWDGMERLLSFLLRSPGAWVWLWGGVGLGV